MNLNKQKYILSLLKSKKIVLIGQDLYKKMSSTIDENGYVKISLGYPEGKQKTTRLHQVVILANKGLYPENMTIDHINESKTDNRIENLEVVSRKENILRSFRSGKRHIPKGENHSCAKLTDLDIKAIKQCYKKGSSVIELAKKYRVSFSLIYQILANKHRFQK